MAFVFQSQRWKQPTPLPLPGPGSYQHLRQNNTIGGFIPSQPRSQIYPHQLSPSQHQILQSALLYKNQRYHHQSSKKLFKRAQSAKLFTPLKSPSNINSQINKQKNTTFQVTSPNNKQQNYVECNEITTSYKKPTESIHSRPQNIMDRKAFSDKNLRKQMQNSKSPIEAKQNLQFLNQCFKRPQSACQKNTKINNFMQNQYISNTKNNFIVNDWRQAQNKQQNFIIASGNCKKVTLKKSSIASTSRKQLSEYGKVDPFDDTTAIDDSYSEEDSIEYIVDATPGPGEYQLRKDKHVIKSTLGKFGVTEKRFKQPKRQQSILNLNVKIPNFKKQSKASQQKVAFGKIINQTSKQNFTDFLLYEDHQSIQNKCIQNLVKDRSSPGSFLSKKGRFDKIKKQPYFGPDFYSKQKEKPITLPDSIFMSKVQRRQRPFSPTAQVDFQGQDYKTIKEKVQNFNERKQLIDSDVPGFYISEPRFKYKTKEMDDQIIPRTQKSGLENKKQLKSYTFRRQQTKQKSPIKDSPCPWSYSTQMKWIKPSHHVRYKFSGV